MDSLWECKSMQPLCKNNADIWKKVEIYLPYDPTIPLLDIYTQKTWTPSNLQQHYKQLTKVGIHQAIHDEMNEQKSVMHT